MKKIVEIIGSVLYFFWWLFWAVLRLIGIVIFLPFSLIAAVIFLIQGRKPEVGWVEHFLMLRINM